MDRSWKEGEDETRKGQSRMCLDKWLKSVLLRAGYCFGRVVSGQTRGERRGLSRCFFRSSSPQQPAALMQIFSHAKKKQPKINNRSYALFPFPLYTPVFSKSKVSVVLYRKANKTLHGDRKFPQYQ